MGLKRIFKKITKPIAKVFDKIIPNEIKPALPYLAAVAPFILPPGFGSGFASGLLKTQAAQQMAARALVSGAANLGSQLAQEGSEGDFLVYPHCQQQAQARYQHLVQEMLYQA